MRNAAFSYLWTVAVPAIIVIGSLLGTLWLYKLFTRTHHADRDREG